ncbi:PilZ domain-containing protein [Litorivivens sp.]|uniref:PilZ domain-containing protein n=1 Tax=Litorivivens sp. TaxID=2020868 RepID=UPI0035623696
MADHRIEKRYQTADDHCLDIYLQNGGYSIVASREECQVTDISKHGLKVRCINPLRVFERFRLRFHLESGNDLTLFGTVRWVVAEGGNRYLMGLLLEDTLGTDYLLWQNRLSKMLLRSSSAASLTSDHASLAG